MSDTKISALTAATSVGAADLVPIVQGGVNKSATASILGLPPFSMVQTAYMPYTHNSSPTMNFPQTCTNGNTLFLLVNYGANVGAMTTPTGWTQKFSTAASDTDSQITLYTKSSAGTETSIALAGNAYYSSIFFELPGSRTITVNSTSAITATTTGSGGGIALCPSFTPTAGAMVFAACGATGAIVGSGGNSAQTVFPIDPNWITAHVSGDTDNPRMIICHVYRYAAPGTVLLPPPWVAYGLVSFAFAYGLFSVT